MEQFIVSARKYRPQTFDTVVGQQHITTTLKNAIKNQQLAHAFLFCGPRGVGKTTCARILAKTINCENPTADGEACDQCHSCTSFNEGTSLNYFELDAASNNSVDNIRDLTEQIRFVPQYGKYKVYVIDEVHMLSQAAFNAFLKTLEEPPSYAIFILATTEKHKILPTILSRCQIFDFKRISTADTVLHLEEICRKENTMAERPALQLIAQKSEGCLRDALSIMDKIVSFTNGAVTYANTLEHLNILDEDCYFKLLDHMLHQNLAAALLLYDDINRKGFEGDMLLNGLAEFIRNLLVCQDEQTAALLDVVESFSKRYLETASKVSPQYLISCLNVLNEAELNYKQARNKKLHTELCLIRLCYLRQVLEITAESSSLTKKKIADSGIAFRRAPIRLYVPAPASPQPGIGKLQQSTQERITSGKQLADEPAPPKQEILIPPVKKTAKPLEGNKLINLQQLRNQVLRDEGSKPETERCFLQYELLNTAWKDFADILKKEKNPSYQPLVQTSIRITSETTFEAICSNNIDQKFIEQERNRLFGFLKEKLKVPALQFTVVIEEKNTSPKEPAISALSSREQYAQMVQKYPLTAELKNLLKLDLDY